jgi:hypothetical protein
VIPLHVAGVGLWTPGFADAAAWLTGAPDPAAISAGASLLPPALRRRATPLARMVAEVAAQAAAQASLDLGRAPLVLGSAYGEIGAAVAVLEERWQGEGLPSPTRFHNSVHNGPAAYVSIATGNRGFSTALAAGPETPAAALLEAAALLSERGGALLVVLADEPPPAPFARAHPFPPAAAALVLSAEPGPTTLARLSGPRRGAGLPASARWRDHPCAGGLSLAAAVAGEASGAMALGPAGPRAWAVDVAAEVAR